MHSLNKFGHFVMTVMYAVLHAGKCSVDHTASPIGRILYYYLAVSCHHDFCETYLIVCTVPAAFMYLVVAPNREI